MKNIFLLILITTLIMNVYGQETQEFKQISYSTSLGAGHENNIGNIGIFFNNEVSILLNKRIGIAPGLTAFQSIKQTDPMGDPDYSSHYCFMLDINLTVKHEFKKMIIEFQTGPSGALGKETFLRSYIIHNDNWTDVVYENRNIENIGLSANIKFSTKNSNKINHYIIIKSRYQIIFPEYLGLCYGIYFKI